MFKFVREISRILDEEYVVDSEDMKLVTWCTRLVSCDTERILFQYE
jgi:hypothetical protein